MDNTVNSLDSHPLGRWIRGYVVEGERVEVSRARVGGEWAYRIIFSVGNVISNVATAPISLNAGKNLGSRALGGLLAYGNGGTWEVVNQLSGMEIGDELFERLSDDDRLMRRKVSCGGRVWDSMKLAVSIFLGGTAKTGLVLVAAQYEKGQVWLPITMGVVDTAFAALSWKGKFDYVERKARLRGLESHLQASKEKMISALRGCESEWLSAGKGKYLTHLRSDVGTDVGFLRQMLAKPKDVKKLSSIGKWHRRGANAVGAAFTFFSLVVTWELSGVTMGHVTKNKAGQFAGQTFVTLTHSYNFLDAITGVCRSWWFRAVRKCRGEKQRSLGEMLRPRLYWILNGLGLVTAGLSWGVNVDVAQTEIENKNWSFTVQVMSGIGISMVGLHYLTDAVEKICVGAAGKWGDEDAKLLVKVHRNIDALCRRIDKITVLSWAKYLNLLPEDLFGKAVKDLKITRKKLGKYLEKVGVKQPLLEMV